VSTLFTNGNLAISFSGLCIPPYISRQNMKNAIFKTIDTPRRPKNEKASAYNIRNVAYPWRGCGSDCRRRYRNIRNQFIQHTNQDTRNHQHWNPRRDNREPCGNKQPAVVSAQIQVS
jgi:hypothetical protein